MASRMLACAARSGLLAASLVPSTRMWQSASSAPELAEARLDHTC